MAAVWVVAGAPGAGKWTVAGLLLQRLRPVPAVLDKDVLPGGLVGTPLAASGRPHPEVDTGGVVPPAAQVDALLATA